MFYSILAIYYLLTFQPLYCSIQELHDNDENSFIECDDVFLSWTINYNPLDDISTNSEKTSQSTSSTQQLFAENLKITEHKVNFDHLQETLLSETQTLFPLEIYTQNQPTLRKRSRSNLCTSFNNKAPSLTTEPHLNTTVSSKQKTE